MQQYCGDEEIVESAVLAVQEACTNAMCHSGSKEDIVVCLCADGGDLIVEVRDQGAGFDLEHFDLVAPPGLLETGGRGLYLMAHVMDVLTVSRDEGNLVRMVKHGAFGAVAAPPASVDLLRHDTSQALVASRAARAHVMLEEIDEAFIALDWEYRISHVNALTEHIVSNPRDVLRGRRLEEALPALPNEVRAACREAMEFGRSSVVEFLCGLDDRWSEARIYPTLAGISMYVRDIDQRRRGEIERHATEERLQQQTAALLERVRLDEVLLSVDQLIHSTLEIDEIIQRALDEALEALHAEAGTVEMREGDAWQMRYQRGVGPGEHGQRRSDWDMPVAARVAEAKAVVAYTDLLEEPETVAFASLHGVRSCLAVPLVTRELIVGSLAFWGRSPRLFSALETEFAQKLASSVSLALENSRLYEQEALAARLGEAPPQTFMGRLVYGSRFHPLWVLLVSVLFQALLLVPIGASDSVRSVYGLPGSLVALVAVVTGALAGPRIGALAAASGGGIFFVAVAEQGSRVSPMTTLLSAGVWVAAAFISGYLAESLRAQAERRRATGVALGKAAAVREAELAEQRRVEALAAELRVEREQLLTMIEQIETSVTILDRDFCYRVVNSAYARNAGRRPEELVGVNHFDLFPDHEAIFRKAVETGEEQGGRAMPLDFAHQPERGTTYWDWRLAPVKDTSGHVRTLVLSLVEVTDRVRSAKLGETMNAINAAFGSKLDARSIEANVLQLAGEALSADCGWVVARERGRWRPIRTWNLSSGFEAEDFAPDELPVAELALREGRAIFSSDYEHFDHANLPLARRLGMVAIVVIPITVDKGVAGCVHFMYRRRRSHSPAEMDFVREVGAATTQALNNARLLNDVRRVATTLQENLIHPLDEFPGLDLGRVSQTAYHPELVGGDFSHVFRIGEGRVGILIGDVEGKGIRAAGLTETVRSAVVAFSLVDPSPEYVLGKANQMLVEAAGTDQFVTACFLLVDLRSGETSYAIAGHPSPVLKRADGASALPGEHGLPLGIFPATYALGHLRLDYGDVLVLFTDGVTEARHAGQFFGESRVLTTIAEMGAVSAQEAAERLRAAASQFAQELRDDLQILTVRYLRQ